MGKQFTEIYEIIVSDKNIKLAYRNIKRNKGSKTCGTDKKNIKDIEHLDSSEVIKEVKKRLMIYKPKPVRRVMIPKANGKLRPLGIPTIWDRIIQQMFKQVLEPICEAKFYKHSYGFRPLRSTSHAYRRVYDLVNCAICHYVVDIDIKGFFDNINHNKLIKQMWNMGIRDKKVLAIIKVMLKAEIKGKGIPTKGTPQGGILSPLLSNIVLNDVDWWIGKQWEEFKTKTTYCSQSKKSQMLKKTSKLKEVFIVRYADDFKIFCKSMEDAKFFKKETERYLKEKLYLDTSPEKSQITNLKKKYSEFLGIKFKCRKKRDNNQGNYKAYVIKSNISDKARENIITNLREHINKIAKESRRYNIDLYNSYILGIHNYYKIATNVSLDFTDIAHRVHKLFKNKIYPKAKINIEPSKTYKRLYGKYNHKVITYNGITLYNLQGIRLSIPKIFYWDDNIYSIEGRKHIKRRDYIDNSIVAYLINNPIHSRSIEYNDNRISKYYQQVGKCAITDIVLMENEIHCHHIQPVSMGGTDKYKNLVILHKDIHKLIHLVEPIKINEVITTYNLTSEEIKEVNKYRKKVGNKEIND